MIASNCNVDCGDASGDTHIGSPSSNLPSTSNLKPRRSWGTELSALLLEWLCSSCAFIIQITNKPVVLTVSKGGEGNLCRNNYEKTEGRCRHCHLILVYENCLPISPAAFTETLKEPLSSYRSIPVSHSPPSCPSHSVLAPIACPLLPPLGK